MGTLGKDLLRMDRGFFEVTVLFADQWYEIEGREYKYGELTTELLNFDATRFTELSQSLASAIEFDEQGNIALLRKELDEAVLALPLYRHLAGRKALLAQVKNEEYIALGQELVLVKERYAAFLQAMFEKKVGTGKGSNYAEQIYANAMEAFVSGTSLGESFERDPAAMKLQFEVKESANGRHVLYEKLEFSSLLNLVYTELFRGMMRGNVPKKCSSNGCPHWFLQEKGHTYSYCANPAPGETEKTCRDIGATASYNEKVDNNPVWGIHKRIYKRYHASVRKKKMSQHAFEKWAGESLILRSEAEAAYKKAQSRGEEFSFEEYEQALTRPIRIIFLDVDGVLNSHSYLSGAGGSERGVYDEIDEEKVGLLQQLVERTGAKIVLSSSWRTMLADGNLEPKDIPTQNLLAALQEHGLSIYDKTPDLNEQREAEILDWLSRRPETKSFVILDDEDSLGWDKLKPWWVKTSYSEGLTQNEVEEAIAVLNGE